GGVIQILIDWDCNLDFCLESCVPKYSFVRLDDPNVALSKGWNFRYPKNYNESMRTLVKAYGITFVILVQGQAGKASLIPVAINLGSGLGLMVVATVVSDFVVMNCLKRRKLYAANKYEYVSKEDRECPTGGFYGSEQVMITLGHFFFICTDDRWATPFHFGLPSFPFRPSQRKSPETPAAVAMSSRIFTVESTSCDDDPDTTDPFRIILTSLNLLGVFSLGPSNGGTIFRRSVIAYRSVAAFYIHYVAFAHLYSLCSGVRGWTDIITSFIACSSVFTLDSLSLRRERMECLLLSMRTCLAEGSVKARWAVLRKSRVCTVCIWAYLAAFIVNSICSMTLSSPQSSWDSYLLGANASRVSERKAKAVALVATTLRLYLVDGPWFFVMALFVLSCWVLRASFRDLEEK
ncbi:hypothetical protein HPB47_014233, partial [Ixodes persulcatus]